MKFEYPDFIQLALLPTPIERLEKFSKEIGSANIFIKRDDNTDVVLSGNKVRKLEFLLADAVSGNCDTIITCGGIQSNHARTTAIAAAKLNLSCYLVLKNGQPARADGNLLLNQLVGAKIKLISPEEYKNVDRVMNEIAERLKFEGKNPYVIPEGGSNEIGALGYIKAAEEIFNQLRSLRLKIHHIIIPVGSGGTYAGLLIGKYLYDLPAQIHGINVCDNADFFQTKIYAIISSFEKKYELHLNIKKEQISIIDGYVGKGYGLNRQEEIDLIKQVARTEGVILDPVYSGKAMYGLVEEIKAKRFGSNENILFIHTGGIYSLFPKKSLFF